jgi:hypothetical protein
MSNYYKITASEAFRMYLYCVLRLVCATRRQSTVPSASPLPKDHHDPLTLDTQPPERVELRLLPRTQQHVVKAVAANSCGLASFPD